MRVAKLVFIVFWCASTVSAWDRVGHLVVDAIAWENMSPSVRERAVDVLRSAPADADLALSHLDSRELFLSAGYWPDVVRDDGWPERKQKYDKPTWHYVNHFWRDDGAPLPERGQSGDLLVQLDALSHDVPDAVKLAWLLHLMGDVHQPLHSSARVTSREPDGDRGGNDFTIDDPESWGNLHAFWDSIQMRARRKRHSESDFAWIDRIAREIIALHPRASLDGELDTRDFESWSCDGAEIARLDVYPTYLAREARPSRRYLDEARKIADRQMALAGYRLAALLNELFQ